MRFEKEVKYIGMVQHVLSDGGVYWTVSMFCQEVGAVAVNVMDNGNNRDMLAKLHQCEFGAALTACFMLRPKDKLYRLALADVTVF